MQAFLGQQGSNGRWKRNVGNNVCTKSGLRVWIYQFQPFFWCPLLVPQLYVSTILYGWSTPLKSIGIHGFHQLDSRLVSQCKIQLK